ncbi:MAG: (2Fe-2S)-binding protein [Pseudomonadota bacterium]|nr:(2Fe-2S)-binding protein [Pseudomonadota bacterium]
MSVETCTYNGLNETGIEIAIALGRTLDAVFEYLDMDTCCGCCLEDINRFLFPPSA